MGEYEKGVRRRKKAEKREVMVKVMRKMINRKREKTAEGSFTSSGLRNGLVYSSSYSA